MFLSSFREKQLCCISTYLDDFLHARRADHVGVRVEANLVHYGAVTLQDHERPVYHTAGASFKGEHDVGLF